MSAYEALERSIKARAGGVANNLTDKKVRNSAIAAVQRYLEEADVSDIVENADYHSRMTVTLVEDAVKKKLESMK